MSNPIAASLAMLGQNVVSTQGALVNDIHSQFNATIVKRVLPVRSADDVVAAVHLAKQTGERICIAGGRHAMGGQQFLSGGILLDMTEMNRVMEFDAVNGTVEVQSGIMWPMLIDFLRKEQAGREYQWTIVQKQTGADNLTIGGALSANVHGRCLNSGPFVNDIEAFSIVTADGEERRCGRTHNADLFCLAIGGYGVFGVVTSVKLKLTRRVALTRNVRMASADEAIDLLEAAAANGATYGDFQFAIDHAAGDFLQRGIISVYTPSDKEPNGNNHVLKPEDWRELVYLAHADKTRAFDRYAQHYLRTDGQVYSSDVFQLSTYDQNYHGHIDERLGGCNHGTEMITEVYVLRSRFAQFMKAAARLLSDQAADVIYGTVRLIERDEETFLPWAKQRYACIVFNLHMQHDPEGVAKARRAFRDLIALAIAHGGSYFLTYHRFAAKHQLLAAYPQMPQFIDHKFRYDPRGVFSSTWLDHILHLLQSNLPTCIGTAASA